MTRVEVSNQELRTVRDAMRQLNRMVDELERGDSEKYVLTRHGQMRAVVVSVEYFATLRPLAMQPQDVIATAG
jgi:PHD/YefM family antitoxin component YafN of YafNO toxin-antitoxin module